MKLSFTLKNTNPVAKGKAVVYRDVDPSFNTLELIITNEGEDLSLKGGAPVREGTIQPNGATTIYFAAATVFASGSNALGQMEVKADGYATCFFDDGGGTWAISPLKNCTLLAQASIKITISNITVGANALTGHIPLDYYNFSGSAGDVCIMPIQIARKPVEGDVDLAPQLELTWGNDGYQDVYKTTNDKKPFINNLSFTLRNNEANPIKVGSNTEISLFFVYADDPGYGALCTVAEGNDIVVKQTTAANPWSGGRDKEAPAPIWRFTPQGTMLGTGQNATASFSIGQIISSFQPGPTLMYLSWANVPGYNDGQKSLGITKIMPPVISFFRANPISMVFDALTETKQVELSWQVDNWQGKLVQIQNSPLPSSGKQSFPVEYHEDGVKMELSVVFGNSQHVAEQSLTVGTALQGPVINCFKITPELLLFRDENPFSVQVDWDVCYAKTISFSGKVIEGLQPAQGSTTFNLAFADMQPLAGYEQLPGYLLTINAEGLSDEQTICKTVVLHQGSSPDIYPDIGACIRMILAITTRIASGGKSDKAGDFLTERSFESAVYLSGNRQGFTDAETGEGSGWPVVFMLSDLYNLWARTSQHVEKYVRSCSPIAHLSTLIGLVKEVVDEGEPDWPTIKSYQTIPAYMLQQIGTLGPKDKAAAEKTASSLEANLSNEAFMTKFKALLTADEISLIFPVTKIYMRFMNVMYLTSTVTDLLNELTAQMGTLLEAKTPQAAKAVMATCGKMVDFVYAIDSLPKSKR